jgi:phosphate:Na+ symporter
MGYIIYKEMLNQMLPLFRSEDEELFERFSYTEQAVDSLAKQIVKYVTTLDINNFSEDLLLRSLQVLYAANDLEHIGDLLLNIARIGMKITSEQLAFSEEGHKEIETLYNLTSNNFQQALISLEKYDTKLASRILKEHPKIRRYEKELRYSHFERMQSGNKRTLATSSLHLDMIESLLRIDNHTVNIAQGVVGIL